jgi:hypothetical protein
LFSWLYFKKIIKQFTRPQVEIERVF